MDWISVEIEMPPEGEMVEVKGDYTADGFDFPKAYRRDYHGNGNLEWCSTEWRGTVAVRFWRKING